ncbi:reverse transcriptase domain-containing protein [Tanacetum coccineum]
MAEAGKFKPPPPMVTPVEKRSSNKFWDFHNDKGHNTDECMQLKKQIEELVRVGKLSHLIKETSPWQSICKEVEGPLIIEAEIGEHMIHRMYVDGGSSTEVLYEHCFNRLRPEIKSQMVSAMTSLTGFSGETILPLGQLRLLVVPSTAHGMLKFPVDGGIVTIRSTILIPVECATVTTSSKEILKEAEDCYPLPEINWKVESLCGYPFKCFLDAYKGYHQIQMAESDEEKTAFHTSQGVYCYTKMPFGLKNTSATYEQLVDKAFDSQIGQNIEVGRNVLESLNKKLASLNRFLSKSAEKSLPLFKTLKKCIKKSDFHWTSEAEQAFKQLKQHLSELPLLVAPKPKEELIVYISASHGAISVVLMTERGTVQMPVYFISRALQGPELNYTPMEKLILALVFAAKRLRRYFQAHPIAILADFLVEKPDEAPPDTSVVKIPQESWTLFTDGSSCVDEEYEALIAGLRIAAQIGVRNVNVSVDFKLVANQVLGTYVAKEENMVKYLEKAKSLISSFTNFSISQVPRSKNKKADALSKIASTSFAHLSKQKPPATANPQQPLTPITAQWPFYKWGIDIAGPFPEGPGKVKFLIVAMDYFTKWIEAKAVATITDNQVKKFVWDNIVCRFGLPGEILSENGKQFNDNPFKDWCEKLNITQRFALVKHPQSNRLVERANQSLGKGIKARLGEGNKN